MADNRNKTGNQDKQQQQQPMKKPEQPREREGMGNRDVQKDVDTDETDEQGEITQRNPRVTEDKEPR